MIVKIKDIKVGHRIRKESGDLSNLKKSMKKHGFLNPITITSKGELISGHRRLAAAEDLGWEEIEAKVVSPKNDLEKLEMEMEENIVRKEFSQQELLDGLKRKKNLVSTNVFVRFWNWLKKILGLN